ncbi:MAG: sugar phosphate nucleotidyltransferase [Candidatus Eisenbacteria bacterium]
MPCFLLSGGLGTRLRAVEARPKALVPVAGIPFILLLIRALHLQGFQRVHFLLGHGAKDVVKVLEGGVPWAVFDPRYDARLERWLARVREEMTWKFHIEQEPMGTGGALSLARDAFGAANLVLNADSHVEIVYEDLLATLTRGVRGAGDSPTSGASVGAAGALSAVWMQDRSDYGGLDLDPTGRVLGFVEKGASDAGWINAGAYMLTGGALGSLPEGPSSLERDLLPALARSGRLFALAGRAYFRDIGTPKRLAEARQEMPAWIRRMEDGGEI